MSFDYRKFLAENGLTVGSQLRNQFSEEELPQEEEQAPQEKVPAKADPAKKVKLDKLTAMKDQILAQYKSGKLSLDQYKAKVGNIPQQIQQLRSDIDAELNPEVPEEEPDDDQQQTDQNKPEEKSKEDPILAGEPSDSLQESINQLNKKNMSFDYRKFLKENELTIASRGSKKFIKENINELGPDNNSEQEIDRTMDKLFKLNDQLESLLAQKDEELQKLKSGQMTMDQYKKAIGDLPSQIKELIKYIDIIENGGDSDYFEEGSGFAGSGDQGYDDSFYNYDPVAARKMQNTPVNNARTVANFEKLEKYKKALKILKSQKDEVLAKYKSGEMDINAYKEAIGELPSKIKELMAAIAKMEQ